MSKRCLILLLCTFRPHQKNFGWQMELNGELNCGRNFSKTLTSKYQFKPLSGRMIMNTHAPSIRNRVIVFTSIHRIGVDGQKRCENATCGRALVLKTEGKKWRFQTNMDTCGRGQQSVKGTCASVRYLVTSALQISL